MTRIWIDCRREEAERVREAFAGYDICGYSYTGEDACDTIAAALQEETSIVCLGPLSNIAGTLMRYPSLTKNIREILFQGGCLMYGNVRGYAERNLFEDPEAGEYLMQSDIPLKVIPLEVSSAYAPYEAVKQVLSGTYPKAPVLCGLHTEIHGTVSRGKMINDIWSDAKFAKRTAEVYLP